MEIVSGFFVGIMGSVHCAGMCGPIALALPAGGKTAWPLLAGRLTYNGGRIVTVLSAKPLRSSATSRPFPFFSAHS
ncbi:MAG: hypothetical protein H6Q29_1121 [Bacteroidetes bacterium]|nr:hypothetical protein [Bacteroidota bacterium]